MPRSVVVSFHLQSFYPLHSSILELSSVVGCYDHRSSLVSASHSQSLDHRLSHLLYWWQSPLCPQCAHPGTDSLASSILSNCPRIWDRSCQPSPSAFLLNSTLFRGDVLVTQWICRRFSQKSFVPFRSSRDWTISSLVLVASSSFSDWSSSTANASTAHNNQSATRLDLLGHSVLIERQPLLPSAYSPRRLLVHCKGLWSLAMLKVGHIHRDECAQQPTQCLVIQAQQHYTSFLASVFY